MMGFIFQHGFAIAAVVYWLYSAAVIFLSVGPTVRFLSVRRSRGLFTVERSPHASSRIPGLKILGLIVVVPLLLVSATSCSAHYTIHPGALNVTDSAAYDVLLIAETTIDQAGVDLQSGPLPAEKKTALLEALGALIRSYNLTRASWLTYRSALAANVTSQVYFDELTKNISDLMDAIRKFAEVAR